MIDFTAYRALDAEGARIALCWCHECGAAIVLDPDDLRNPLEVHRAWHARFGVDDAQSPEEPR